MTQTTQSNSFLGKLRHQTRHVWNRPTLSLSTVVFLVVLFASSYQLHLVHSLLLSFDIAAASFLLITGMLMARSTPSLMQHRASVQREGRWAVLAVSMMLALVILIALSLELRSARNGSLLLIGLAAATVMLSWGFLNTMFALHYAHDYYDVANAAGAGLDFPGAAKPDYWDFMYFAFVIGMTFQVSDVQISSRIMRRVALLHSLIAFFFNVVIIAITVNIVAGLG